jgi:chromate transport protein ChrA
MYVQTSKVVTAVAAAVAIVICELSYFPVIIIIVCWFDGGLPLSTISHNEETHE